MIEITTQTLVEGMDDKKNAAWEAAKRNFFGVRRALHDTIAGRTQGIYGEIVEDWTRFNPAGKPHTAHLSFGPKRFHPSRHEPDGTEINNRLADCYDKLGDLERLTHRLKPDERCRHDTLLLQLTRLRPPDLRGLAHGLGAGSGAPIS